MKTFSLLALIWTLYYLAKRITGNLLTTADLVVCGCVLLFCIGNLLVAIYQKYRTSHSKRRTPMEDKTAGSKSFCKRPAIPLIFCRSRYRRLPFRSFAPYSTTCSTVKNGRKSKNRIVNILLKLLCFFPAFALWDGWKEQSSPQLIEQTVDTVMENHSGSLYLLFWQEESLLVFEWDALSLSLYHPSQQLLDLAQTIARSEGFFLYQF